LCWVGTGYGLFTAFAQEPEIAGVGRDPLSLMAPPLLLLIALVALAMRRAVRVRGSDIPATIATDASAPTAAPRAQASEPRQIELA